MEQETKEDGLIRRLFSSLFGPVAALAGTRRLRCSNASNLGAISDSLVGSGLVGENA
jgi:hypothetical protein